MACAQSTTLDWETLRILTEDNSHWPSILVASGHWPEAEFLQVVRQRLAWDWPNHVFELKGPIRRGWARWVPWRTEDGYQGTMFWPVGESGKGKRGAFPYTSVDVVWRGERAYEPNA